MTERKFLKQEKHVKSNHLAATDPGRSGPLIVRQVRSKELLACVVRPNGTCPKPGHQGPVQPCSVFSRMWLSKYLAMKGSPESLGASLLALPQGAELQGARKPNGSKNKGNQHRQHFCSFQSGISRHRVYFLWLLRRFCFVCWRHLTRKTREAAYKPWPPQGMN